MPPSKNDTPSKHPEDSSMTYEESEDMYFWVSQLEGLVKRFVIKRDLEKSMEGKVNTMDLISSKERIKEKMG